jgi:hypothetical protein
MAARLSTLHTGRFLAPGRFLVVISVRGWVDPRAMVRLEELRTLKKSTSSGTWTSDLPDCSIVPQPTTPPRATIKWQYIREYQLDTKISPETVLSRHKFLQFSLIFQRQCCYICFSIFCFPPLSFYALLLDPSVVIYYTSMFSGAECFNGNDPEQCWMA